ncbi:hypothetical protein [Chitinophaga filiformis]|uniref:NusG domain-containing protein n=1 Tax=Chitinophaga filiformis TaxID=104663 RepID=A0ABY4HW38_CHIFI|nr:hypothetical protein [Chitinophaga filiformis]UPK68000.1 hypothetical protein MYF79_23900 [Chitinophaga filiformis]
MRKAITILCAIALFATIGGVFAFKARYTGFPVFTRTTAVVLDGYIYTRAGSASFCYPDETLFVTVNPYGVLSTIMTTYAIPMQVYTLTRVGGTETVFIPNFCTVSTTTATRVTAVD